MFYQWKLERFQLANEAHLGLDIFPSSPSNKGIQLIKEQLITQLNTENPFDFEFQAQEKDFLSIINTKNNTDYLNLIFLNGLWVEEFYLFSLRGSFDEYKLVQSGEVELKLD